MKATAYANINMALTKYWGKRDEKLMLPQNSSVSITLDAFGSFTTVEFSDHYVQDECGIGDNIFTEGEEYERIVGQLDDVRKRARTDLKAKVVSKNTGPTAAGLASSASGAAALAAAAAKAADLDLSLQELSILSRLGSGSACRSIYGGFVEWQKGEKSDGSDSYAVQLATEDHWPELRMLVVITQKAAKTVKSRAGMKQTAATSPFYKSWLDTIDADIQDIKQAIQAKDFTKVGTITEANWLKFQGLLLTTNPVIHYWEPASVAVMREVFLAREEGISGYITMDAGPQVKMLCLERDISELQNRLKQIPGVLDTVVCKIGKGIEYRDEHLF